MIDDDNLNRSFSPFQLESKLLLNSVENPHAFRAEAQQRGEMRLSPFLP
jgi:hypothetical protein